MFLKAEWYLPLYFVNHDEEPRKDSRPEVNRLGNYHYWKFNAAWQRYCFGLLAWSKHAEGTPEYFIQAFNSLYAGNRAFTNFKGVDEYANFITEERLDEELPEVATLVCGGSVLTGYEDGDNLVVETMNSEAFPPDIYDDANPQTKPWLFTCATIVTTTLVDGKPKVIPFPQLDGADVWVPIVSNHNRGAMTYPLSALTKVTSVPRPYYP